jgi:hypothetical protein
LPNVHHAAPRRLDLCGGHVDHGDGGAMDEQIEFRTPRIEEEESALCSPAVV